MSFSDFLTALHERKAVAFGSIFWLLTSSQQPRSLMHICDSLQYQCVPLILHSCVSLQGVIVREVKRVYLLCFLIDTNKLHSHAICRDAVNMCTSCAVHACRLVSSADMFTEGPHISTGLCAKPVKHPAIRVSTRVHTDTHILWVSKKEKATEMYLATCYILH